MRKVLSFVLVLSLVLGSFSMAFAGTEATNSLSDIAGHANVEAITVNFNLNIINGMGDGTFAPDTAVTRAQFAAMMTRALAIPDSALAGYTSTSFKDTAGYTWAVPYLAFCQSKGILVGDGAGNVMPGKTVSVNEAMTMVMRAVGYTNNSAALVGVWPANYVSLAQNNDLYDKVATAVGVTRANAAQIIYNALTVDKVEVSSDGKTTVLSDRTNSNESKWKIVNMLTTGLNCYSKKLTPLTGEEEAQINLKAYVGKDVTAFLNSDDEIVAISAIDSDTITGKFEKDQELYVTGGTITLSPGSITLEGDDDVDYNVKTVNVSSFILNGSERTNTEANGYDLTSETSITINGDISGKNINSISSIATWVEKNAKKVGTADINSIKDSALLGSDFTTLKDKSIDKNSFELVGVKSLDDIKADNIVAVYEKGNDGDIVKVAVGTKVVEGKVTTTKDSGKKIVVDGTTYEKSGLNKADTIQGEIEAGDTVKLYLDSDGDVYTFDITSGTNDKYAAVMDIDTKYDKVKLYTSDDDSAWYEYTSDASETAFVTTAATGIDNFSLVAYGVNNKGKIDTSTNAGIEQSTNATVSGLTLKTTNGSFKIDKNCAVFGIDTTNHKVDNYSKITDVDSGTDLGPIAFMYDKDKVVVAIMVDKAHTSATASDSFAVIHEVNSTTNADGDKVQQVIGFMDGAALDKLTNDTGIANNKAVLGSVWKVEFDADGLIKNISAAGQAKGVVNVATRSTVGAIDGNSIQLTGAAVSTDWNAVAPEAKVYRAVLDKDGALDVYKASDVASINEGYHVWLYNTVDDDDSAKTDGYDVVIYVTKADAAKL